PLLALFVDVKVAVASLVIPNLVMDGIQLRRQGPVGDTPRRLAPLLVFTMLRTVVGTKLLVALSGRAVTLSLGAFVRAFVRIVLASVGLTAAALVGFGQGVRLQDKLDQRTFNRAVLIFLAVLGVWLVMRAI